MESTTCSARLCQQPAEERSPVTCLPLCTHHLQADMDIFAKSESEVSERIIRLKKYQTPLRLMQQRLVLDLQLLDDTFNGLRETLDRCQNNLAAAITKHHDQLMDSLKLLSDLDDFEKELKTAKDANDLRQAFIVNEGMNKSLDALHISSRLVSMDEDGTVRMAAFPDTISRIKDLQACTEMQLGIACLQVDKIGVDPKNAKQLKVVSTEKKVDLNGEAVCMALCSNTSGFALDESGSIVRAQSAADGHELPQPSVFVAVERTSIGCGLEERIICFVSIHSDVVGSLPMAIDSDQPIKDLHCDNDRQLLFAAQRHAVTVADLCGVTQRKISASDLENCEEICCIAGDFDKLYLLALREWWNVQCVFVLSKESGQTHQIVPVPHTCYLDMSSTIRVAVRDHLLFLSDSVSLHTVCIVTGLHIASQKVNKESIMQEFSGDLEMNHFLFYHNLNPLPRFAALLTKSLATSQVVVAHRGATSCKLLEIRGDASSGHRGLYAKDICLELEEIEGTILDDDDDDELNELNFFYRTLLM